MDLVIDANVLFSALIRDGFIRRSLIMGKHTFYVPEFIIDEVFEHIIEITSKSGLSESEINFSLEVIISEANIQIVTKEEIEEFIQESKSISNDPDDVCTLRLR